MSQISGVAVLRCPAGPPLGLPDWPLCHRSSPLAKSGPGNSMWIRKASGFWFIVDARVQRLEKTMARPMRRLLACHW